ncbi:hypothetical protein QEN19_001427 [Hanseniaspora menglaensis]
MPPSKLYIKVKSFERLIKEETNYNLKLKKQLDAYEILAKTKNVDQIQLKVSKDLFEETSQILIPQLYLKLDQFEKDLEEYLEKHEVKINLDINAYLKNHKGSINNLKNIFDLPLDANKRNVKLNNDMTSNNEPLDMEEFEYMKERIICLFLFYADIKKKRFENFNAKSKSKKYASLEDAVNDDEIY